MNYEEKYKQALERARIEYKNEQTKGNIWVCEKLSTIFPELRESEDERIRNFLIKQANSVLESMTDDDEEVPAWKTALACLEMAACKEQQMISQAKEFIAEYFYEHPHTSWLICSDEFQDLDDCFERLERYLKKE